MKMISHFVIGLKYFIRLTHEVETCQRNWNEMNIMKARSRDFGTFRICANVVNYWSVSFIPKQLLV